MVKRLITILATGYILFYFSELVFWARWQPGVNSLPDFTITWLVYSVLAYAFLCAAAIFRARSLPALFLCGAIFGWLDEGVLVQTMYENFPLHIAWTGLAWHALISVLFGWVYLRARLRAGKPYQIGMTALIAGVAWGLWAIFWWVELPASMVGLPAFSAFSLGSTLLLIVAYWAGFSLGSPEFTPGRWGPPLVAGLSLITFILATLTRYLWALLVLPPLLGLVFLALQRNRSIETQPAQTDDLRADVPAAGYLALLGIPLGAILVYAAAQALHLRWATNWFFLALTAPAGVYLFVWSVARLLRAPKKTEFSDASTGQAERN